MKNWKAVEWCLFILMLTIPICLIGVALVRSVTNSPIPVETAAAISDLLKVISGGILGICGTLLSQNKETK